MLVSVWKHTHCNHIFFFWTFSVCLLQITPKIDWNSFLANENVLTWVTRNVVKVLLYVHRNCRLIMDGSPGRSPQLSHSSWALTNINDDELMLHVLRCQLTYSGQVVTNAEARFNKSLRPRKPEGSLGRTQPRTSTSTLTQLLNYDIYIYIG